MGAERKEDGVKEKTQLGGTLGTLPDQGKHWQLMSFEEKWLRCLAQSQS